VSVFGAATKCNIAHNLAYSCIDGHVIEWCWSLKLLVAVVNIIWNVVYIVRNITVWPNPTAYFSRIFHRSPVHYPVLKHRHCRFHPTEFVRTACGY